MKKNYLAGCLLLAGTLFVSCSDNNNGNEPDKGNVVLDKDTKTELVLSANDKGEKNEGIRFTTQGPWKATVEEVDTKANTTIDWLTLSQYSGDKAGSYTITLTLNENQTGKTRKAAIHITCGDTTITITVEQQAGKEEEKPGKDDEVTLKKVKSVTLTSTYGNGHASEINAEGCNSAYTYSYDEKGRIITIVENFAYRNIEKGTNTYTFDYRTANEISMNILQKTFYQGGAEPERDKSYLLTLNEQGYVTTLKTQTDTKAPIAKEYNEGRCIKASYTKDNRLEKIWSDKNDWSNSLFYQDGLLTKAEIYEKDYGVEIQEFTIQELYPNRYPAIGTNIDLNAFIVSIGEEDAESILYQIGLLGKGSDCLMETTNVIDDEYDLEVGGGKIYSEPNKVYPHIKTYTIYPDEKTYRLPIIYEFDNDKHVKSFSYDCPYELWENSYEIHVGNELVNPNQPELGYKSTYKPIYNKKLRDEKDTYTYTVTYE